MYEISNNLNCEVTECRKSNPQPFRSYQQYHRCKFKPCSYLHIKTNEAEEILKPKNTLVMKTMEVERLADSVDFLEHQIIELNQYLSCLNNDIIELNTFSQNTQSDISTVEVNLQVSERD